MPAGLILVMELMKKPSKGTGCTFWQLLGRQEPRDLLQMEPGPAAAAVGWQTLGKTVAKTPSPCGRVVTPFNQGTIRRCMWSTGIGWEKVGCRTN